MAGAVRRLSECFLGLYVPKAMRERLRTLAADDGLTMSSWVRVRIAEAWRLRKAQIGSVDGATDKGNSGSSE